MSTPPGNGPYVGPRPFERGDSGIFFGRERESRQLLSLVIAHRVVLLHATSGAGKTSLVNAGLCPLLEEVEFQVLPRARILGLSADAVARARNVFTAGVIANWGRDLPDLLPLPPDQVTLAESLAQLEHPTGGDGLAVPRAVVFDQFEELFTVYSAFWRHREAFVDQIAEALEADPLLRILISVKEDHLGQVEALAPMLSGGLRARLRLERLDQGAALEAVQRPLEGTERTYAPGVPERLVDELMRFRADTVDGAPVEVAGEFVEPVQLQVVCQNLWDDLPAGVTEISEAHLRNFGDIDEVLGQFYGEAVRRAAAAAGKRERRLRNAVEDAFITSIGTRGSVYRAESSTAGIPNAAIDELEAAHVLRAESRAGAHWYELTHDRLIEPIRKSNTAFARRENARLRRRLATGLGAALALVGILVGVLAVSSSSNEKAPPIDAAPIDTACRDCTGEFIGTPKVSVAGENVVVEYEVQTEGQSAFRVAATTADLKGRTVGGEGFVSLFEGEHYATTVQLQRPSTSFTVRLSLLAGFGQRELDFVQSETLEGTGGPATITLTIVLIGRGTVEIVVHPEPDLAEVLSCVSTCRALAPIGSPVVLHAERSKFIGWRAPGCDVEPICEVVAGDVTSVVAEFRKAPEPPPIID